LLLAPVSIIQKIEAMFRRFLWEGGKQSGRKLHLISWEKISKPILEGGLNFKNAHVQNLALGAKMLWNLSPGSQRGVKKRYGKSTLGVQGKDV
jgi:hypothetical protein